MREQFNRFYFYAIALLLCAVFFCYWPGLSGAYLLDDFNTLGAIEDFRWLVTWQEWKNFVFGGLTGPGGRPVSLFSFALTAGAWPNAPWVFLLGNIAIHLLCALLLWRVLVYLLNAVLPASQAAFVSFIAVALWALSPFQVSTVLYIVQRMTQLSCLFLLIAMLGYWYCRVAALEKNIKKTIAWALVVAVAAVLGFYSKENMALLPLQLLITELLLRYAQPGRSINRLLNSGLSIILLPLSLLVIGYFGKLFVSALQVYWLSGEWPTHGRVFTVLERLYTEQEIVGQYLLNSLLPRVSEAGVFYDAIAVKSTFWQWSVAGWFALHLGLVVGALAVRNQHPVIFWGILWFYTSHLLESSVVMLELRFDHRNYIPSIGIFVVLAYVVSLIPRAFTRVAVASFLLVINAAVLLLTAALWGKPLAAAVVWAEKNPQSTRAIENAARKYLALGYKDEARVLLQKAINKNAEPGAELRYIMAFCETYNNSPVNWKGLAEKIRHGRRDWSLYPLFESVLEQKEAGSCNLLDLHGYLALLQAYRSNHVYHGNASVMAMDELAVRAAIAFNEIDLAKKIQQEHKPLLLPLAYKMNIALAFANAGEVALGASVLDVGIQIAEQLNNEPLYVLKDAKEILDLMLADLQQEH